MWTSHEMWERSGLYGIWKMEAPPRVLVFGWLALMKRIPTMDLLRRRGMQILIGCPMCLRDEESVDHLLLNCKSAYTIWMTIIGGFDCCWALPHSLSRAFPCLEDPQLGTLVAK